MPTIRNTLDLCGDGDDVEIIVRVGESFGIAFTDREAALLKTVGDLHDGVCRKLAIAPGATCLTARLYRDLARQLPHRGERIHPSTRLARLAGPAPVADFIRDLNGRSAAACDITGAHGLALVGAFAAILAFPVAAWAFRDQAGALGLAALAGWLTVPAIFRGLARTLPRSVPDGVRTLGDLVRHALHLNYRRLAAGGTTGTRADIWIAVCGICREATGHDRPIDRNTTFFA